MQTFKKQCSIFSVTFFFSIKDAFSLSFLKHILNYFYCFNEMNMAIIDCLFDILMAYLDLRRFIGYFAKKVVACLYLFH